MYDYREMRSKLFTEDGVDVLLSIRSNVLKLLADAGAVRATEAWRRVTGQDWLFLAALDYMVERGEICEITNSDTPAQYRVFVSAGGR